MAERGAKRSELVIASGANPKARKPARRDWTKKKEETFLTSLAETCNVTRSAQSWKTR